MQTIGKKFWSIIEYLVKLIFGGILRIFKKEWSDAQWDGFFEFIKFGLVGVSNTVVSYVINILTLFLLRNLNLSWDYIAGNLVAFLISVLWSFYWNNKYVFTLKEGESRNMGQALLKTYVSYAFTGIVLNNVLSFIWIDCLHISKYVAPVINLILGIPINFFMNKLWAFKKE